MVVESLGAASARNEWGDGFSGKRHVVYIRVGDTVPDRITTNFRSALEAQAYQR